MTVQRTESSDSDGGDFDEFIETILQEDRVEIDEQYYSSDDSGTLSD